jgi:hypothetical protein
MKFVFKFARRSTIDFFERFGQTSRRGAAASLLVAAVWLATPVHALPLPQDAAALNPTNPPPPPVPSALPPASSSPPPPAAPPVSSAAAPAAPPAAASDVPPLPAPGMPRWARPAAPALGPTIELDPELESDKAPAPGTPSRGNARNPTMTLIDRVRGTISKSTLGGYGEFVFNKYPDRDSAFEARRFVLFLYSPITEHISMATEIEWERGGTPVRTQGQLAIGEVLLEFAVLDVKLHELLTLRGGVLLMPLGRLNVNHDAPSLELTDRPLMHQYIIPTTWWEMGAGLTGRKSAGPLLFSYELYAVNGLTSNIADGAGLRGARGSVIEDNNSDKAFTGRLSAYYYRPRGRFVPSVELGLSGYTGKYDRSDHRVNIVAADLLVRNSYLEFAGEFARVFLDSGFDDDYLVSSRRLVPTDMMGFYVEARGRLPLRLLFPRLRVLPLWLGETSILVALRYEEVDTDMSVVNANDRRRLSLGLNLRMSAAFVFKNEVQWTTDDARGTRREIHEDPALGYVASLAFLF